MRVFQLLGTAVAAAVLLSCPLAAQQSWYENFRAHNARMAEVQPSWMGPVTQSDARLAQAVRLSVANWSQPGSHPISYGNNHGITAVFARRVQLEVDPPPFYRNHAAALPDGFANVSAQAKLAQQGRAVNWTMTGQLHVGQHAWFDVENNFSHVLGSSCDGQTQNMITPVAFYMIRRRQWKPEHAAFIVDGGVQNATSHFHYYNHNVIAELRILY